MQVLQAQALGAKFGVLEGVDFVLAPGQCLVVLGPNGAGKSTLMKLLAGMNEPVRGEVRLHHKALAKWPVLARAKQLAYLAQHHEVSWNLSVAELVALGGFAYRAEWSQATLQEMIAEALSLFGIEHYRERAYFELSGGERQRVQLARVWVQLVGGRQAGAVALLDEPFSHLDAKAMAKVLAALKMLLARGCSLVVVTHDWDALKSCADWVLVLAAGGVTYSGQAEGFEGRY